MEKCCGHANGFCLILIVIRLFLPVTRLDQKLENHDSLCTQSVATATVSVDTLELGVYIQFAICLL